MTGPDRKESPQEAAARIVSSALNEVSTRFRIALAVVYGFVGFECAVTGWAYLPWTKGPAETPAALELLNPIWPWGVAWALAGLLGIAAAVAGLPRILLGISVGAMAFMHLVWTGFYAYTFFDGADHRAYVTSSIYLRSVLLLVFAGMLMANLRPKVDGGSGG